MQHSSPAISSVLLKPNINMRQKLFMYHHCMKFHLNLSYFAEIIIWTPQNLFLAKVTYIIDLMTQNTIPDKNFLCTIIVISFNRIGHPQLKISCGNPKIYFYQQWPTLLTYWPQTQTQAITHNLMYYHCMKFQ